MKTLLISFILLLPVAAAAQTDNQRQKDSLRMAIAKSSGKEKLDNMLKLSLVYFPETADDQKMDTLIALLHEMNDEAVRQRNMKSQAIALSNILIAYWNKGNYDEVISLAPNYMSKINKQENERSYYVMFYTCFKAYLNKGDYDTALAKAKQMYGGAQKNSDKYGMAIALSAMADLYEHQDRNDEQEKYIRQSIELWKTLGDKNLGKLTEACFQLCNSLYAQKKYDEALQAAAEYEKVIYRYEKFEKAQQPAARYNLYYNYLSIYLGKKDFDRAETYCNKVDSLATGRNSKIIVANTRAEIFNARKQYDKALQMTDSAMKLAVTADEQNLIRGIKMKIYADMGKAQDLYSLASEVISVQDSVHTAAYNKNLDELRTRYETDKITAEKKREHIYLLVALAVLLLLSGILALYIALYRKKQAAYQELVRKSKEWAQTPITVKETDEQQTVDETDRQLFEQLQSQFQNELLYRNSTMNIDELANRMKINKNYISQAINRCTGKNFNAFINEYRVKEAVLLMSSGAQKYSLEGLAFEVGFNDRRTFYNAFKKMTGLSPSEFQNNL